MSRYKILATASLLCWLPAQNLAALESDFLSCDSVTDHSIGLDLENMANDPAFSELLLITEEIFSMFASTDRQELIKFLRKGDHESAALLAGLSEPDLHRLEISLDTARQAILDRYPGLLELMPKRLTSANWEETAIAMLERLPRSTHEGEPTIIPFGSMAQAMRRAISQDAKNTLPSSQLLWMPPTQPGLKPPPDGGFGPCPGGGFGGDCPPVPDLPAPPEEDDQIPPDGNGDGEVDCAWGPYLGNLALCAATGPKLYWLCAGLAVCSWCEGGWVDNACDP